MSDVLDYYSEWGAMKLEELEKLKAEREKLENASTIAPTDTIDIPQTPYGRLLLAASLVGMDGKDDPVNPSHYQQGSIELIDFIDDWKLDFYQGSIVQYLLRWRQKGGVQDLEKALWYLKRYIDKEKGDV